MSHVVIFFFFFVALDKLILLIAYALNKSSRICLRGGCHKCHISHIEMKNSKNTPLFPPLDAFSEK